MSFVYNLFMGTPAPKKNVVVERIGNVKLGNEECVLRLAFTEGSRHYNKQQTTHTYASIHQLQLFHHAITKLFRRK
jgi:hypothetical protein